MTARWLRRGIQIADRAQWVLWWWKFQWGSRLWGGDFQQRRVRGAPERYLNAILRRLGANVDCATVKSGLELDNLTLERGLIHLAIGANAYLGPGVFLDLASAITIEAEAVLAPQAMVLTHGDVGNRMLAAWIRREEGPVTLKNGCWVGARAVILPGITVGEGAIVGAGSVVTHDVPDFTVVAGVPARMIRRLEHRRLVDE